MGLESFVVLIRASAIYEADPRGRVQLSNVSKDFSCNEAVERDVSFPDA
jgi:hypothetical protein